MKRAILTGFEPFGDYGFNPVQDSTKAYDGKRVGDIEVKGLILPSAYDAFGILSSEMDRLSPDIVLETGFASRIHRIRLEAYGRNEMHHDTHADSKGRMPDHEPIVVGGAPYYRTNVDNVVLARSLYERGIPAEVWVDADAFICNALLYLTAMRIALEGSGVRHAYFHTPATDDYRGRPGLEGKTTIPRGHLMKAIEVLLCKMV